MNYSAVLVTSKPQGLEETLDALKSFENVEVHQVEKDKNRCIVVIEAPDTEEEMKIFKKFSQIPTVIDAALVVHHFEDEAFINPLVGTDPLK